MELRIAGHTDVGRVREQNEDSYLASLPAAAVADGMGGHNAGEVASRLALEVVDEWRRTATDPTAADLRDVVLEANRAIREHGQSSPELKGMGTTLTVAWVQDGRATVAHVGDSRAYLLRDAELQQLTNDQTLVRQWVAEGRIEEEDASRHPYRNYLLQALGSENDIDVELLSLELEPGDRLLLSTDGMHGPLPAQRIVEILNGHADAQAAVEALVAAANEAGGHDNITVVLLDAVADPADETSPAAGGPVVITRPTATASSRRSGHSKRLLVIGVLAVGGVALASIGFTAWMSSSRFVVAAQGNDVVILQARAGSSSPPRGEVVKVTDRTVDSLPVSFQRQVRAGIVAHTLEEAEQVVANLPRTLGPSERATPSPEPSPAPAADSEPVAP